MRDVTYSMSMSLDGYIVGPDGTFDWSEPDEAVFRYSIDEVRECDVHLLGRRLYETMTYWDEPERDTETDPASQEWTRLWRALPKVVFSRTLTEVTGHNTRLALRTLEEEILSLRAEGEGDIAIGGASLAADVAALDLIDEYRVRIYPVVVGGGVPMFARNERQVNLELVESRTFPNGVVLVRHRVIH